MRSSSIITRSNNGESENRVPSESSKTASEEGTPKQLPEKMEGRVDETDSDEEDEDVAMVREELEIVKKQLHEIQLQFRNLGPAAPIKAHLNPIEASKHQESGKSDTVTVEPLNEEEFPTLNSSKTLGSFKERLLTPLLPSWKDKVTTSKSQVGMTLKFVPPLVEDGQHVVHIECQDVCELASFWDCSLVIYVVGGLVSADILRGFIRKHWTHVRMPGIHSHEDGYFMVKFSSNEECTEILNGGPYFLNKAPMIVKKWSKEFDFKEEILRVIPVWIRLPSLPLHCWGAETLSRIMSAVGVPVVADDCTAKQLKVSYARVLVEIDVTKEFMKEIRIRDDKGKEFFQKAIPEWKPYYCRMCHKLGHECKEEGEEDNKHMESKNMEDGKSRGKSKKWIPTTIARFIQGVSNMEELRAKISKEDTHTKGNDGNVMVLCLCRISSRLS